MSNDQRQDEQQDRQPDEDEIEQVREERLDPDNRPDGAEVDNTQRTFDPEKGMFTDVDEYDEVEPHFVDEELPSNRSDDEADEESDEKSDGDE